MNDPISPKKFIKSFVELKPWLKNIRFIAGLVIILFTGLTVYRAYFMKTDTQEVTIGTGERGGTVISEGKKGDRKVGLEFFLTSNDAGAVFFKDIGGNWRAGIGAEYDFDEKEVMPRTGLQWTW